MDVRIRGPALKLACQEELRRSALQEDKLGSISADILICISQERDSRRSGHWKRRRETRGPMTVIGR